MKVSLWSLVLLGLFSTTLSQVKHGISKEKGHILPGKSHHSARYYDYYYGYQNVQTQPAAAVASSEYLIEIQSRKLNQGKISGSNWRITFKVEGFMILYSASNQALIFINTQSQTGIVLLKAINVLSFIDLNQAYCVITNLSTYTSYVVRNLVNFWALTTTQASISDQITAAASVVQTISANLNYISYPNQYTFQMAQSEITLRFSQILSVLPGTINKGYQLLLGGLYLANGVVDGASLYAASTTLALHRCSTLGGMIVDLSLGSDLSWTFVNYYQNTYTVTLNWAVFANGAFLGTLGQATLPGNVQLCGPDTILLQMMDAYGNTVYSGFGTISAYSAASNPASNPSASNPSVVSNPSLINPSGSNPSGSNPGTNVGPMYPAPAASVVFSIIPRNPPKKQG